MLTHVSSTISLLLLCIRLKKYIHYQVKKEKNKVSVMSLLLSYYKWKVWKWWEYQQNQCCISLNTSELNYFFIFLFFCYFKRLLLAYVGRDNLVKMIGTFIKRFKIKLNSSIPFNIFNSKIFVFGWILWTLGCYN